MLQLRNARLVGRPGLYSVLIENGRLVGLDPTHDSPLATETVDLLGAWLAPGMVDLQLNGALGIEFSELEDTEGPVHLERISRFLWSLGISAWLPTLISVPVEKLHRAMAVIAGFEAPADGARILGVHLEGPFLNPEFEGAHLRHCLLPLNLETVKTVLGDFGDLVRLITLAPELDPEGRTVEWLAQRGVLVSLGHTAATYAEAEQAIDRGARLVTHIFNAQRPLHHREPGVIGAALLDPRVHCLCIPDGVHLHPATMRLVLAMKSADRVTAVSDAVAPLGMGDGTFDWHGLPIQVQSGRVTLPDGRLAGSALSLVDVAERLVAQVDPSPELALRLSALNPRTLLGLGDFAQVGAPVDLLVWTEGSPGPVRPAGALREHLHP